MVNEIQAQISNNNNNNNNSEVFAETIKAKIYGKEILYNPGSNLFIPPDALSVMLSAFEGPLDLLLFLINKQNINILDIPMAELTQQYLDYISIVDAKNFELAGEYLLMAAMLIEIKARMLLPKNEENNDLVNGENDNSNDPRTELVRKLLAYEKVKLNAKYLTLKPKANENFYYINIPPQQFTTAKTNQENKVKITIKELSAAWQDVVLKQKLTAKHQITKSHISIREYMSKILTLLNKNPDEQMRFEKIFHEKMKKIFDTINQKYINDYLNNKPIIVSNFMAILELSKEGLININQDNSYEFLPIYLQLNKTK